MVQEPEFEYVSAKHKRRAVIKEKKELAAKERAAYKAKKTSEDGTPKAVRANDLASHLLYQQKLDALDAAGQASVESRPSL